MSLKFVKINGQRSLTAMGHYKTGTVLGEDVAHTFRVAAVILTREIPITSAEQTLIEQTKQAGELHKAVSTEIDGAWKMLSVGRTGPKGAIVHITKGKEELTKLYNIAYSEKAKALHKDVKARLSEVDQALKAAIAKKEGQVDVKDIERSQPAEIKVSGPVSHKIMLKMMDKIEYSIDFTSQADFDKVMALL